MPHETRVTLAAPSSTRSKSKSAPAARSRGGDRRTSASMWKSSPPCSKGYAWMVIEVSPSRVSRQVKRARISLYCLVVEPTPSACGCHRRGAGNSARVRLRRNEYVRCLRIAPLNQIMRILQSRYAHSIVAGRQCCMDKQNRQRYTDRQEYLIARHLGPPPF